MKSADSLNMSELTSLFRIQLATYFLLCMSELNKWRCYLQQGREPLTVSRQQGPCAVLVMPAAADAWKRTNKLQIFEAKQMNGEHRKGRTEPNQTLGVDADGEQCTVYNMITLWWKSGELEASVHRSVAQLLLDPQKLFQLEKEKTVSVTFFKQTKRCWNKAWTR